MKNSADDRAVPALRSDAEVCDDPGGSSRVPAEPSRPVATEAGAKFGPRNAEEARIFAEEEAAVDAEQAAYAASRPVAAGSKAHGSETWDEAQDRLYRERHPEQFRHVAACSKAWAEEIRAVLFPATGNNRRSVERLATQKLIDYLDRAGFFADEATLAEIENHVHALLHLGTLGLNGAEAIEHGIALATAVRKLGIGGGK